MKSAVPPYFDGLIASFRDGRAGRNVHLGYWDDPPTLSTPCTPGEFEAAQARLTEIAVALSDLAEGQDVLDVGCGFGGALQAIGEWRTIRRTGVNIDPRQLEICRSLGANDRPLTLVAADACALPFAPRSFDRLLCVEAMFHFRSRADFLREAARVLRPGGSLIVSDILLRDPGSDAPIRATELARIIGDEYGPWPHAWIETSQIVEAARAAGLRLDKLIDATRQTLPSYRVTAPRQGEGFPLRPSAGLLLRWLHARGYASYPIMTFVKA